MADLVDIASKEVGYIEGSGNNTKYGKYTGANGMSWCHSFISWCGHEAGINTSIVPKTASTDAGMQFFKNKKRFKKKGTYVPKRNDIVYFKTGRSHAGIVEYVKGSTLHTIEGNSSDMVKRNVFFGRSNINRLWCGKCLHRKRCIYGSRQQFRLAKCIPGACFFEKGIKKEPDEYTKEYRKLYD